ncbi:MAG: hypothetical protein K2X69_08340, partial [Silvanigrellaceae bacterium]|nr:hypothetical protein [Silvanigrellaceae bacterium]
ILLAIIGILIFKNNKTSNITYQQNDISSTNKGQLTKQKIITQSSNQNQEKNKQNILIKPIYNEKSFKNLLKNYTHQKIPNTNNWYFVSNVLAIDKNYLKNKEIQILWEDNNFYYISNSSNEVQNSFEQFNPNYSLVAFEKNNSIIGIINGYFFIELNNNITDHKYFENHYNVNIISSYQNEKIIIARAKRNTNIINTFSNLKSNTSIKSLNIEVITEFPKLE